MKARSERALAVCMLCAISAAAQQQGPPAQPGTRWTEEQLRRAVAPARVGQKLTPKSWPGNARVAVCLSFDVDNESYLLARGETSPTTLSAADFGAETGLPRILDLLDRYQVPASFFIPAVSALLHPEMIPAILKSGRHEIGVHGWIHESLVALASESERGTPAESGHQLPHRGHRETPGRLSRTRLGIQPVHRWTAAKEWLSL